MIQFLLWGVFVAYCSLIIGVFGGIIKLFVWTCQKALEIAGNLIKKMEGKKDE